MRKNKPNRLRKIQLHIMLSEAEDQMICERMKRCGYESKSEYIRRMSIDGGILVVDDAELIRQLNYEISKIGNNINQITRVANLTKSVSQEQIDTVKEMMTVIWEYQKIILSGNL